MSMTGVHKTDDSTRRVGVFSKEDEKNETEEEVASADHRTAYKSQARSFACFLPARRF